jgi:hypothetical protein
MGEGRDETHNHLQLCDRRGWPRSLWIDRSYDAYCSTNALAISRSDSSVDTHRNALTFGKPVAQPECLRTQPPSP